MEDASPVNSMPYTVLRQIRKVTFLPLRPIMGSGCRSSFTRVWRQLRSWIRASCGLNDPNEYGLRYRFSCQPRIPEAKAWTNLRSNGKSEIRGSLHYGG